MKFLKITVPPVILLSVLMMGGCATTGPETTITGFQKVSSFENKKVSLSLPVVVEKDMETKKNPDATEKTVADDVYAKLKGNLNQKGLLVNKDSTSFSLDLRVHYVSRAFAEWEYFGSRILTNRGGGGQILIARAILKSKNNKIIAQIDSINNWPILYGPQRIIEETAIELANQIEKILKEGVNVGKSP